jgi:sialidase-1
VGATLRAAAAMSRLSAQAKLPPKQDLFVPTARYPCFRQPVIVTSNAERSHVIAFAENRNVSACDPAGLTAPDEVGSLLTRRSLDGGASWADMESMYFKVGLNIDFLAAVTDKVHGKVWLFLAEAQHKGVAGSILVFESSNEGASWSDPKELGQDWDIKLPKGVSLNSPGCAHGIQIEEGLCPGGCLEAGRLVVPFTCSNTTIQMNSSGMDGGDKGCLNCISCNIFSDDGGRTWEFGGVGNPGTRESQITQIASPGSSAFLYVNERNMGGKPGHRMFATSVDAGKTYGGFGVDPVLTEPVTPHWTGIVAATTRLTEAGARQSSRDRLLFSGVLSADERRTIGVRLSYDSGKSWSKPKAIWAGPAAYSDLARIGDDSAVVLFENGDTGFAQRISAQQLPLAWLEA